MRIESVTLRGILRFTERATLSLVDAGPGLLAVVGANGEGKTGTLEAAIACLYRVFPSRSDRELVDYATAPDAYIETTFALDGQGTYVARLNVDGPHRKTDAVLSRLNPDGSRTILTDGKVTSYDAAIAALLPPLPALLASVFSAQNRAGSFITLDKKGRKQLFASLLGLDAYDLMAERAKGAAGLLDQAIAQLTTRRELLARDAGEDVVAALDVEANRLQVETGTAEARRANLQRELDALDAELASLQEAAAQHAAARARLDRLAVELEAAMRERAVAAAAHDRLDTDATTERQQLQQRHVDALASLDKLQASTTELTEALQIIDRQLARELADVDARIANNRQVLENADAIRAAARSVDEVDGALALAREAEQALNARIEGASKRDRVLSDALHDIAAKERELARAKTDVEVLGTVPCGGAGEYATCQFLTAAAAARTQVPYLEAAVAARADTEQQRRVNGTVDLELRKKRTELQQEITVHERARIEHQKLAARLPDLQQAETKIEGHEARKYDLRADADRRRRDAQAQEQKRQADLCERSAERNAEYREQVEAIERRVTTRRAELDAALGRLADRLTGLTGEAETVRAHLAETQDASQRAAAQTALQTIRRREWEAVTQTIARLTAQVEDLGRRRAVVRERRTELQDLDHDVVRLRADLIDWQLLAKALGRDGLPTLEIDAAGPTVSAFCNDLLQTCFGPRFTVELITQEAKATKSKDGSAFKEVFELRVFDRDRGSEPRDLADLSGGEQVLVDEALKSAIALLVNTRNAHPIRTCWRDETTGALDGDNAAKYVDMLRRVLQLGGFHQVLFVSHNPDAARQADVQVRVSGGCIELVQPPFAEAA